MYACTCTYIETLSLLLDDELFNDDKRIESGSFEETDEIDLIASPTITQQDQPSPIPSTSMGNKKGNYL